jgi:hypothetical protein
MTIKEAIEYQELVLQKRFEYLRSSIDCKESMDVVADIAYDFIGAFDFLHSLRLIRETVQ